MLKRQEQLEELLQGHINGLRKQRQASPAPQEAVGAHKAAPLEPIAWMNPGQTVAQELPPVAPAPATPSMPNVETAPIVAEQVAAQETLIIN